MKKEELLRVLELLRFMRDENTFSDFLIKMYLERLIEAIEEKYDEWGTVS